LIDRAVRATLTQLLRVRTAARALDRGAQGIAMASVKIELPNKELRRTRLPEPLTIAALREAVGEGSYTLQFVDDEGDVCVLERDAEVEEAARLARVGGKALRVVVSEPASDFKAAPPPSDPVDAPPQDLTFLLNGTTVHIENPDPRMTLLDYLRGTAGLTGTKGSCRQGGCGACTVVMQTGSTGPKLAINACLRPLCSLDGRQITTTEGLGNARDGYHVVQDRIATGNGSQCGFCTPGHVMNMYSLLETNPRPTAEEIENHFDGNICRCTGYRPILESFKSFAGGPHGEEAAPTGCCGGAGASPAEEQAPLVHKHYGTKGPADPCSWVEPASTAELSSVLWGAKQAGHHYRIVAGNTGHGVYPDDDVTLMVNVTKIPEMLAHTVQADGSLTFGAAVPIQVVIDTLEAQPETSRHYHSTLAKHMRKIANYQVRNVGSWAGNLAMCHAHPVFQSDMATILFAAEARVSMMNGMGQQSVKGVDEFFAMKDISGMALTSLQIPPERDSSSLLRTYKAMKRHQNSHAFVNAGINCTFTVTPGRGGATPSIVVTDARLIFGGIRPLPQRAMQTERFLVGKNICEEATMHGAIQTLSSELVPSDDPGYTEPAAYRTDVMTSYLYKFALDACRTFGGTVSPQLASAADAWMARAVSSSTQTYDPSSATGAATPKLTSHRQAAGEAKYADDHPPAINGLFASYVLSTVSNGRIQAIDTTVAASMDGFVDFIAATDMGDKNEFVANFGTWPKSPEVCNLDMQIFAPVRDGGPGDIEYWGQPIGMVIADTREHADRAAKLGVTVTYTGTTTACVTIEDAIAMQRVDPPRRSHRGDCNSAFAAAGASGTLEGEIDIAGQYHFYMETQTSVAIPMEDDGLRVICSTQSPSSVQSSVASTISMPLNKVIVEMKRAGGGYGGKISNATPYACAAAFAAHKHRREVRLVSNIKDNMTSTGKRSPWKFQYRVAFTPTGRVTAVSGTVYTANWRATNDFQRCYDIPNWDVSGIKCNVEAPPNTWMRSPTELGECTFMNEIMDHVAMQLNMPAEQVRSVNLAKPTPGGGVSNLPSLFSSLLSSVNIESRRQEIASFNQSNTWRKRGIAAIPTEYNSGWGGTPSHGALVDVYPDGTILIYVSGCEIGQGLYTKVAQVAAITLGLTGDATDLIEVQNTATDRVPNGGGTGGSTTSGKNAAGVQLACSEIRTRFDQIRRAQAQARGEEAGEWPPVMSKDAWSDLVAAASHAKVDMCVKSWVTGMSASGNGYCAAVAEVEIDVLTGELQILQADVLYDAGKSLSPLIDIGQVEGAFMIGVGHLTTEALEWDRSTGEMITVDTWEYKPPQSLDIPIVWNTTLLPHAPNPTGFLGSKVVGEPPLICANAVLFAIKDAIAAARAGPGGAGPGWFALPAPATPVVVQQLCPNVLDHLDTTAASS
jgi:xanthine dehydrogenase/oxidase